MPILFGTFYRNIGIGYCAISHGQLMLILKGTISYKYRKRDFRLVLLLVLAGFLSIHSAQPDFDVPLV